MICSNRIWEVIRPMFNEDEKESLRDAVNGHVVCPEGISIDEKQLPTDLRVKFLAAYAKHLK